MNLESFIKVNTALRDRAPLRATVAGLASLMLAVLGLASIASPAHAVVPTISCSSDPNLFNTGYDGAGGKLGSGSQDVTWQVAGPFPDTTPRTAVSLPPAGATWAPALVNKVHVFWADSPYDNAEWISQQAAGVDQPAVLGDWYYRFDFNLAAAVDPATFALAMSFYADNDVSEVFVNDVPQSGKTTGLPSTPAPVDPYAYPGYLAENGANTLLSDDWQTGPNSIIVQIKSAWPAEGFLAQMRPSTICPTVMVTKDVASRVQGADQFAVSVADQGTVLESATTAGTETEVSTAPASIRVGDGYTVSEAMTPGSSSISNYDRTATCVGRQSGTSISLAGTGPTWSFTPPEAEDYECTITNAAKSGSLSLVKRAGTPTDVNGDGLTNVGDTIAYTFEVTNDGDATLNGIRVSDPKIGAVTCPETSLAPGASQTCSAAAPYTVTDEDVAAGEVRNIATASGDFPGSSVTVTSPPSTTTTATDASPALTVVKSASPATVAAAGETVTYSFLVTNTGDVTLTDVGVDETAFSGTGDLSAIDCPAEAASLAPDAQVTCTATYVVTQADIDAGSVTNTAVAQGTPPGSNMPTESPGSSVTVPADPNPGLSVAKQVDPGTVSASGDRLHYTFVITNTGTVTIHDVDVEEIRFSGSGAVSNVHCPAAARSLAPGERVTCTATYTVTDADLRKDSITNTARAVGEAGDARTPVESPRDTAVADIASPPGGGKDEDGGDWFGLPDTGMGVPMQLAGVAGALALAAGLYLIVSGRRRTQGP